VKRSLSPTGAILKRSDLPRKEANMANTKITKDTVIGDVLKANPAAIKVIQKYFGQGCFTCPGMNMESISFGALMHNIDPEVVVKEINELEE
jgi:hybrid cluster-associated redox disulfide protein